MVGGSVNYEYTTTYEYGITVFEFGAVGALAGENYGGTIRNVFSSMSVEGRGADYVGGLVGLINGGTLDNGYSSGPVIGSYSVVTAYGDGDCLCGDTGATGGLVGGNSGTITNSYATGSVTGLDSKATGGLVGVNTGLIDAAYATGAVSGAYASGSALIGGFAGTNTGTLTQAYWDEGSTRQTVAAGSDSGPVSQVVGIGGATGLSPYSAASYDFDFSADGPWVIVEGSTRP